MLPAASCSHAPQLPQPQTVVLTTGARLTADEERLRGIHAWTLALTESIACTRQVFERPSPERRSANRPEERMRLETRTSYC
jgi:hypothetical protein